MSAPKRRKVEVGSSDATSSGMRPAGVPGTTVHGSDLNERIEKIKNVAPKIVWRSVAPEAQAQSDKLSTKIHELQLRRDLLKRILQDLDSNAPDDEVVVSKVIEDAREKKNEGLEKGIMQLLKQHCYGMPCEQVRPGLEPFDRMQEFEVVSNIPIIEIAPGKQANLEAFHRMIVDHVEQNLLCVICNEEIWDTVFLPCYHFGYCPNCSKPCTKCPVCQSPIGGRIHLNRHTGAIPQLLEWTKKHVHSSVITVPNCIVEHAPGCIDQQVPLTGNDRNMKKGVRWKDQSNMPLEVVAWLPKKSSSLGQ